MKKTAILSALALAVACAPAYSPRWLVNRAAPGPAPADQAMPRDLLKENMSSTALTLLVYVERAAVTGPRGTAPAARGYVNHRYEARVLETLKGPALARITYEVMADADLRPSLPAFPLIVSLCGSAREGYYVPDNGYVTPATPALIGFARRMARIAGTAGNAPACSEP